MNSNVEQTHSGDETLFQKIIERKWLLIIGGGVVLAGMLALILFSQTSVQTPGPVAGTSPSPAISAQVSPAPSSIQTTGAVVPTPTISVELQKAIDKQTRADSEYAGIQDAINTEYPWITYFPMQTETYFAFFDIDKELFIVNIYPKAGDDVEQIKAEVIRQLRLKEIPEEKYEYDWTVTPR